MKTLFISGCLLIALTGCVLMPSKFNANAGYDEDFRRTGYSFGFSWDLKARKVIREDYVSVTGGSGLEDMP